MKSRLIFPLTQWDFTSSVQLGGPFVIKPIIALIAENYTALLDLWDRILSNRPDSKIRARVLGVSSQIQTFEYYFGTCLLHSILRHTDSLSKTMQHAKMNAAVAQH